MRRLIFLMVVAMVAVVGPWRGTAGEAPLPVFVTVAPQAYVVERIGGERVRVEVLVDGGQTPHSYKATPRQMVALGSARLYFQIGLPFERRLLEKITGAHSELVVVDMARGIERRMMDRGHGAHDGHDHHGHHDHGEGEPDPHVWLSPPLLKVMAANVAEDLAVADPAHAAEFERNLAALEKDVEATHAKIGKVLAPYRGRTFYVFHPAFGYFGDAYGLKQSAVEIEGKSPTPKKLASLIKAAKADGVKIIFVQPQFDRRAARSVADAIDGAVVPMDPLARDVLGNLEAMAAKVEVVFM